MTRINLVVPKELTDQHLKAEIRELPRIFSLVLKSKNTSNIPANYKLGTGHVKFFYNKIKWLYERYLSLLAEAWNRGIKTDDNLIRIYIEKVELLSKTKYYNNWQFQQNDVDLSRQRLKEKIELKPLFYKYYKEPLVQSYFSKYPWYSSHSS